MRASATHKTDCRLNLTELSAISCVNEPDRNGGAEVATPEDSSATLAYHIVDAVGDA